jgi:hypothetical protein
MYDNKLLLLKTLKSKYLLLWEKLTDIYNKGYHTLSEGKYIFDAIKLNINKYRLTTNSHLIKQISISEKKNFIK